MDAFKFREYPKDLNAFCSGAGTPWVEGWITVLG